MNWTAITDFLDDCRAMIALLLIGAATWAIPKGIPQTEAFLTGCKWAAAALDD